MQWLNYSRFQNQLVAGFLLLYSTIFHSTCSVSYPDPDFIPSYGQIQSTLTSEAFNQFAADLLNELIPGHGVMDVKNQTIHKVFSTYYGENYPSTHDYQEFLGDVIDNAVLTGLGPESPQLWHPSGGLIPPQTRMVDQLRAAVISGVQNENHYQPRQLIGQALHLLQQSQLTKSGSVEANALSAYRATLDFLRTIKAQVQDASKLARLLHITSGRDVVLVLDVSRLDGFMISSVKDWLDNLVQAPPAQSELEPNRFILVTFNANGWDLNQGLTQRQR